MYTKIEQNNKPHQDTTIIESSSSCEALSKDLEKKLTLKRNASDFEMMSPSEEEIMRCLRTSKARMERGGSFDSALGMDVEQPMEPHQQTKGRRLTLTITDLPLRPALLPIAEPNNLLDSPTTEVQITQITVPTSISSRLLLEENVVEIPEDHRLSSNSRRQSSQSCLSDYQSSECSGVRYVRTPSVVVSDYSDDTTTMCGISQEEIEYFRAQRLRRRFSMETTSASKKDENTSDVSNSSSCSNLYYCESKINPLDKADCYVNEKSTPHIDHKITESSTCQAV